MAILIFLLLCYPHTGSYPSYASYSAILIPSAIPHMPPTLLSSYWQLYLICLLLCYPHTGSYPSYASYCTLLSSYRQVSLICLLLSYPHNAGIFHSFFCSAILIRTAFPRYYNFSLLGYPQTGNLAILALG